MPNGVRRPRLRRPQQAPLSPALQSNPVGATAPVIPPGNFGPLGAMRGGFEGVLPPSAGTDIFSRFRAGQGVEKGSDESRVLDMTESAMSSLGAILKIISGFFKKDTAEEQ